MENDLKPHLSKVLDVTPFKKGQANLIIAPCHSGKTTAAFQKIVPLASRKERVLYLIDTTAGREALLNKPHTRKYSDFWPLRLADDYAPYSVVWDDIRIMTYHHAGYALAGNPHFMEDLDVIICDEMHNLIKYLNIENANLRKQKPTGDTADIAVCKTALNELARLAGRTRNAPLVVIMTATPQAVIQTLDQMSVHVELFDYTDQVYQDKTKETIHYTDLKSLLQRLSPSERTVIYVPTIQQMQECEKILSDGQRNVCCLWSIHSEQAMTKEQLKTRSTIIDKERIPADIDVLLINAAYETSINLNNEDFKTMIIHSGNRNTQIQVRGRLRHDIDKLYLHDNNKTHEHISEYFPSEYFNRILTSTETAEIARLMDLKDEKGHQLKWPSICKALERDGATVQKGKKNGTRYYTITPAQEDKIRGTP